IMAKTMLVILSLIAYSNSQNFYSEMSCANCTGVNDECIITTTGFNCEYNFDAKKLINNGDSSGIPKSLRECTLPGMEFKIKEALYGFCCVWSPKIGCQKIKKSDDYQDLCFKCTRAIWSPVMDGRTCPCGDWYMD
ncbi:hypothetical protein KR038_000711, partial [Drosophila bunnanda]